MVLRELLASSGWIERTQSFARTMRRSTKEPGGLLLVGTPGAEPWHLAAHLDDEARFSGVATLIRYRPPADAPPHLSVTLQRLEQARRGETVFVVSEENAPASLLERTWDARKTGATILSLDTGDSELQDVAHESLVVVRQPIQPVTQDLTSLAPTLDVTDDELTSAADVSFDTVQHLVSVAAGEATNARVRQSLRDRLSALLESISGPRFDIDR
jgi:hypothetical protein